jgi:hypothetical protein
LYPYGSNRNLNRQKYLAFKNEQITNPAEQLFIAPKYLLPHPGQSVVIGEETFTVSADMSLNRNQDKYGQIEASKQFEAIFPGNEDYTVDEVIEVSDEDSFYDIVSNAIDFNIEEVVDGNSTYRIVGEDAVIHFNSGQLGGYEFPFKYDDSNNHLELVPIEVESYKIPKYPVVPAVGDKFIITGIAMPDSMIDAAESNLLIEAAKYLLENSEPRVAYSAKVSEIYFHQQYPDLIVTPGMYVSLNASRLGGGETEQIRIINIKKYINYKSRYEFQLSNYVSVNAFARLVADVKDTETKIQIGDKTTSAAYKRGMLAYDYLKKALEQDTQIKGGLVLSSLIELLLDGEVRSGINGLDIEGENSIYLWAGGTLQQAIEFLKMKQGQEHGDTGGIKFVVTFGGNIYCNDGFFNDGNFVNGYFSGKFTSNSSGNKVLIDPDADRKIRLIDENDNEVGALGFFSESGYTQGRFNLYHKDENGNVIHTLSVSPYFMQIFDSSGNGVSISGQGGVASIKLDNLPTETQGLGVGRLYRNGNNVCIV